MPQQIFGAEAVVSMVNRALSNTSPANAVYKNQVATAGTTEASQYAYAQALGAQYAVGKTPAELSALLLSNVGVENEVLESALSDYIAFHGPQKIGIIALQLGQVLANLEGDETFGEAAAAWNQEVTNAYTYSSNPANTTPVDDEGGNGSTFTLTTGIDNFKGATGDDTFIGGNGATNTTGPADQLDGGAGVDTFKFYGGAVSLPTLKNIEKLFFSASSGTVNAAGIAGVEAVEVNAAAGTHTVTLAAAQALTLSDITAAAAGVATTVNGSAAAGITLNNVIDKSVTPNGAQTLNVDTRDTALTLNAVTAASNINLNNAVAAAGLTKLTVTGDAKLTVGAAGYTGLTTVDASANTAGVDFRQGAATDLTFTGGTGADRVLAAGTLNAQDKLDGGEGVDTVAITAGGLTAPTVANVKNFEILEVRGSATALTQDASVFDANNTLTGLRVVNTGTGVETFTVTNLAATAKDDIVVTAGTAANATNLTTTIKGFVSGGTSDSATVTVNANSTTATGTSSVTNLTFENVDVLNLVSKGTVATNANTINVAATDLEKLVVTGNIATTITANVGAVVSSGITEVDASGLVVANGQSAGLTFTQAAAATQSLLVTGSNGIDNVTVTSAKGTVVANGGNDVITFNAAAAALGDQSVNLSAKDFVANTALNVTFTTVGNQVIDFSSDIEALLKIGGVNLGTTTANQAVGTAINGQNNVAFIVGAGATPSALQFDLNGDGVFNAADDLQITLTGVASVTYNAANDYFVVA